MGCSSLAVSRGVASRRPRFPANRQNNLAQALVFDEDMQLRLERTRPRNDEFAGQRLGAVRGDLEGGFTLRTEAAVEVSA
jgi:hypothetical protein